MAVLFVGDSPLKYLHHVLDDDAAVRFSSGFRVEQMWALFAGILSKFNVIVIHAGTNNIPVEEPETTLHRYKYLMKTIWDANPTAKIIASAILPRDVNYFQGAGNDVDFLDICNRQTATINAGLEKLASTKLQLEFSPHPSFGYNRRAANRRLLSRDGLHLTPRGIEQLYEDTKKAVNLIRARSEVCCVNEEVSSVCSLSVFEEEVSSVPECISTAYKDAILHVPTNNVDEEQPLFSSNLDDLDSWPLLPVKHHVSSPVPARKPMGKSVSTPGMKSLPISVKESVSAPVPASLKSVNVPARESVRSVSASVKESVNVPARKPDRYRFCLV